MSEKTVVGLIRAAMRKEKSQEAAALYERALKLATETRDHHDPLVKIIKAELKKFAQPDHVDQ
jgi:hypothetical protein